MTATPNTPVREIELHAREYLAEIAVGVIHERSGDNPLEEIRARIMQNTRAAESERSRLVPLIERFTSVRDRIRRKGEGENFLANVVQTKIDQMELNRLQLQLQFAKMQVALEMLAQYTYAEDVLAIGSRVQRFLR